MKSSIKILLATSALAACIPTVSVAQDVEDEVIVTATRRAESIQDVPIAVTAILPDTLEKQGVVNIQNLTSVAPSFSTSQAQTASGTVVLRVRGVGTTANNIGFESAVGVFIDGAYQSRPGVALGEFVDVERVEVLRGPQGTLFGRNTSAGALNITNVAPQIGESGGFINATYGNYDHISMQGAVNVPISDNAAARLTGALRNRDGYLDIHDGDGDKIGESNGIDQFYLRGQLGFEGSSLKGRLVVDYSESDSVCCAAVEVQQSPVEQAGLFGAVGLGPRGGMSAPNVATSANDFSGAQAAVDDLRASSHTVPNPSSDQIGFTGELEFALSDSIDAVYIGSYREYEAFEEYDSTFSGLDLFNVLPGSVTNIDTMTHEVRLQGTAMDDRLDWLVGAYYSDEDIFQATNFGLGADYNRFIDALLLGGTAGAFPTPPILANGTLVTLSGGQNPADVRMTNAYTQDSQSWSLFTHNIFDVTDDLSVTVGLRYSDESKDGSFSQPTGSNALCPNILPSLGNVPAALAPTLFVVGCLPFVAPADLPPGQLDPSSPFFLPLPLTFDSTFADEELIYTGKLSYELDDSATIYAGFTHGYKSGGFNLDSTAAVGGADPRFASEEVDAFEVGLKTTLADGRIRLNVAAFHEDFTNFQVLEFTGAQFQTFNVPKARTQGVEIEADGRLSDNLSFNAGLTVLDAEYPEDCATANEPLRVQNLCGFTLTNAPKTVGILGANYDGNISSSMDFFLNGQVRYEGDRRTSTQGRLVPSTAADLGNTPLNPFDVQESTWKVNARAGIVYNEDLTLEAWATNLTNEVTRGVTFNTVLRSGSRSAFIQEPRMYGMTVRKNF